MRARYYAIAALCCAIALPAFAQDEHVEDAVLAEDEAEEEEPAEPVDSRFTAAGWCAIRTSSEPEEGAPGCDGGLGLSLFSWRRTALVAVVGGETIGAGIAWVVHRGSPGSPTIAVAAGVVVAYDDGGIDGTQLYPALGATLSFGGGGR